MWNPDPTGKRDRAHRSAREAWLLLDGAMCGCDDRHDRALVTRCERARLERQLFNALADLGVAL